MVKKKVKKSIETLTHDEATRKNIPTAECQSVMNKQTQSSRVIAICLSCIRFGALRFKRRQAISHSNKSRAGSFRRISHCCAGGNSLGNIAVRTVFYRQDAGAPSFINSVRGA